MLNTPLRSCYQWLSSSSFRQRVICQLVPVLEAHEWCLVVFIDGPAFPMNRGKARTRAELLPFKRKRNTPARSSLISKFNSDFCKLGRSAEEADPQKISTWQNLESKDIFEIKNQTSWENL